MTAAFIAGDWGTSRLRLSLCDENGVALDSKSGPGIGGLGGQIDEAFFPLIADWGATLPIVLCGMAGSSIGWREVPYLPCPTAPEKIAGGALQFEERGRHIAIAPGLCCGNVLGSFDVLRGEETQILGALRLKPALARERHMLGLPGTHTKWVTMRDGVIEHFLTGVSGELFVVLEKQSVLIGHAEQVDSSEAFRRGVNHAFANNADTIHLLFATRSLQLAGHLKPEEAASYLSGLIIGRDVAGAAKLLAQDFAGARFAVIGSSQLAARYGQALAMLDLDATLVNGDAASLAGMTAVHRELAR